MKKTITIDGSRIVYSVYGQGEPVMLVHGFGEKGDVWTNQVNFLQENFRLFVPDLPGSGESALTTDMSIEGMAEVLHAIIHEEDLHSCAVIGHSMGGYIALAFAEKYWNHVHALGLFHSSAFADTEAKKATRRKGIEFIREHGGFEFLKTATPNLFSPDTKENDPALISQFLDSLAGFSGEALIAYYEAMMQRPDRTQVLKDSRMPVLFVLGKHDTAIPLEDGLKQTSLPAESHIHILQKSGHMGMLEEQEKSNALLQKFLTGEA